MIKMSNNIQREESETETGIYVKETLIEYSIDIYKNGKYKDSYYTVDKEEADRLFEKNKKNVSQYVEKEWEREFFEDEEPEIHDEWEESDHVIILYENLEVMKR